MRCDALLCGSMFPGRTVKRHRIFETSFGAMLAPPCTCSARRKRGEKVCGVYGHPHGKGGAWKDKKGESTMLPSDLATWRSSIGAPWMDVEGLAQSIPPDYAEFIGRRLLREL